LVDHGFDPVASEQQAEINSIEHAIEQHEGKWTCDVITRMLELGCSVEPSKSARVSLIAKAVIESKWHIASALRKNRLS